jgi:UDP-glucose 4-epimerase
MNGDLLNVKHLLNNRNFKLIKGDIRNIDLLEKVMSDIEVVFHLAAQVHVDRSYIEPGLTYDINVMGTQNILEVARLYNTGRIILASTSEVYGSAQYSPIDEKHPLNAPHPYGASKIAADRMCYAYIKTYGMNISIVRLFNIFGPRQRDVGYGGVISIFTRRVLRNIPPMIYGDGMQTRDYTYIEDAVRAYDAVLKYNGVLDEPVNFGSGREKTIIELADQIITLCGKKGEIEPIHVEPRMGEVQRLIANADKAKELLGWEPQYRVEDGLKNFVEWYRNYGMEERIKLE